MKEASSSTLLTGLKTPNSIIINKRYDKIKREAAHPDHDFLKDYLRIELQEMGAMNSQKCSPEVKDMFVRTNSS